MKIPLFIPHVNRPDLLAKAVRSADGVDEVDVIVINNSGKHLDGYYSMELPVPLTFSQTQNYMLRLAENEPFYIWAHSDMHCNPNVIRSLVKAACFQTGKWAALWTNYDALSAINTAALKAIGGWDINLPQYFSDNDCYRRMRLAGYECLDTGLEVFHEASQTINSDPYLKFVNGVTFPLYREYYRIKWGGYPGDEVFIYPFGVNPKEWKLAANALDAQAVS